MAGHNKWAQIKHQKATTDKKRGVIFSKLLKAISIAAREEKNPAFNPRLRTLVEKARDAAVPNETIERAIKKTQNAEALEELILEGYGPDGIAFLITIITDNRNRTINEIKHLLSNHGGKLAEQGSVRWAFDNEKPKFPQTISEENKQKIQRLIEALENHDDTHTVVTNAT